MATTFSFAFMISFRKVYRSSVFGIIGSFNKPSQQSSQVDMSADGGSWSGDGSVRLKHHLSSPDVSQQQVTVQGWRDDTLGTV